MIPQRHIGAPDYVYPVDEWRLVEKRFYPRFLAQAETFFTTANGYLGIRGGRCIARPDVGYLVAQTMISTSVSGVSSTPTAARAGRSALSSQAIQASFISSFRDRSAR